MTPQLQRLRRRAVLIVIALIFLVPVVTMALASAMSGRQELTGALWPHPVAWSNFASALDRQLLVRETATTALVAGLTTIGVLASSIPAAYALARLRWRGQYVALVLLVAAFLLPSPVVSVPIYYAFAQLGWVGTLAPLIVPSFFGDAFAIFLLRQFFLSVPNAMLDAARLEGCSEWSVLRRVVLPMTRPGIAAVALLNVLAVWDDFYDQYLYVGAQPQNWTVSIGLAQYRTTHAVEWNLTMAAAVIVALPLIVVFLLVQRRLTDGIAAQSTVL